MLNNPVPRIDKNTPLDGFFFHFSVRFENINCPSKDTVDTTTNQEEITSN
jgi:hypothetical protein